MIRIATGWMAVGVCSLGILLPSPSAYGSGPKEVKSVKSKVVKTETKGTVAAVGVDTISITTKTGTTADFSATTVTKVERNGKKAALTDIQVGDRAEVEQVNGVTTKIEARSAVKPSGTAKPGTPPQSPVVKVESCGTVTGVGLDAISITTKTGTAYLFAVTATTKVERNGKKALLSDIQTGDLAEVEQINGVTMKIEARGI